MKAILIIDLLLTYYNLKLIKVKLKMRKLFTKKNLIILATLIVCFLAITYYLQSQLISAYNAQQSRVILDRTGKIISILPNPKGYYAHYADSLPKGLAKLLIQKEDRFFYYHPGFNPISMLRVASARIGFDSRRGSSTITQQLTKNLLNHELDRSLKNKIIETIYAVSLETYYSKERILEMYANSLYLGNSIQGIYQASRSYFEVPPELLNQAQFMQILATINSPSKHNPLKAINSELASALSKRFAITSQEFTTLEQIKTNYSKFRPIQTSYFEISSLLKNNETETTIDLELTQRVRDIIKRNIDELRVYNANNAAAIIIKIPENEILVLVGSPDPDSFDETYKIDMLHQPRAIGSTIKPFIYLKAFENNLRPYTLVDDREYKYTTAIDLPLYPKNFDFQYRGIVNLHYALSNSLNVPTVKVLEYIGLESFYDFLTNDLGFSPVQDLEQYQLGIALGALEMKLIDLAHYFTIFPNNGSLKNIKITEQEDDSTLIAEEKYIQLINKILSDRKTGIEQFGLKSELNLSQTNYALKTGTSRDFRDSWIIGYTPDFLAAVWVGNADNSPTEKVSGQVGAGRIWHEIMELLFNTEYNKKTKFQYNLIHKFIDQGQLKYDFEQDDYEKYENLLIEQDQALILLPHNGDTFFLEDNTQIILRAKEIVAWFINDLLIETGIEMIFKPEETGSYTIKAKTKTGHQEILSIQILD